MARRPAGKVALLSIHPQYAELIMAGKKRVEFRKVRFTYEVSHVVVYATAPIKKVIGFFEVTSVDADSIDALWQRYCTSGGIDDDEFRTYFRRIKHGVAISIGRIHRFEKPLPLNSLGKRLKAPQSFLYLEGSFAKDLARGNMDCW